MVRKRQRGLALQPSLSDLHNICQAHHLQSRLKDTIPPPIIGDPLQSLPYYFALHSRSASPRPNKDLEDQLRVLCYQKARLSVGSEDHGYFQAQEAG
jgi:hypothetical protein